MRINRYIALATGMSRRAADRAIAGDRVQIDGKLAVAGQDVADSQSVRLDGTIVRVAHTQTIMLNKPPGYVVSRNGQGSKTVYDLLPAQLQNLKPVGRLDKDSSGLLLMTNDGDLAQQLTHPSNRKNKIYQVRLERALSESHRSAIEQGVVLDDGVSKLQLKGSGTNWQVTMHEGRNRQIRRTFGALGYTVVSLYRTAFGPWKIGDLASGKYSMIIKQKTVSQ